jgi:hypothetical protein
VQLHAVNSVLHIVAPNKKLSHRGTTPADKQKGLPRQAFFLPQGPRR